LTVLQNPGPYQAEPCSRDLPLNATVIPGEPRVHRWIRRPERQKEIIRVSEYGECWSAGGIVRDHVQQSHLHRIGERSRKVIRLAGYRIHHRQARNIALQLASGGTGKWRVAG